MRRGAQVTFACRKIRERRKADLDVECQRLIQQRQEALNAHAAKLKAVETQRMRERAQALRDIVDCIVKLRERGTTVGLKAIRKAERTMTELLESEWLSALQATPEKYTAKYLIASHLVSCSRIGCSARNTCFPQLTNGRIGGEMDSSCGEPTALRRAF